MFNLNREEKFDNYFQHKLKLSNEISRSIRDYVDINKIDYLEEKEFCVENNKKYLLIFKYYNDKELSKIFDFRNNYIILSNKPGRWINFLENNGSSFNGIFMNISKNNINYEKFNTKISNMRERENNVLIIDCCNIDIDKINVSNCSIITIFTSIYDRIKYTYYDQIVLRFGPWVLSELYKNNIFDKKLRRAFEKFMFKENMKGTHNFLLIDNENIIKNKCSNLYYIK